MNPPNLLLASEAVMSLEFSDASQLVDVIGQRCTEYLRTIHCKPMYMSNFLYVGGRLAGGKWFLVLHNDTLFKAYIRVAPREECRAWDEDKNQAELGLIGSHS